MQRVFRLYRRFEAWANDLPRLQFALTVGCATALAMFAVSLLLDGITALNAATLGVMMVLVYSVLDPR